MAKAGLLTFCLILLLLMPLLAVYPTDAASTDDWSMFRHDSAHSNIPQSAGPTHPSLLWNFSEGNFDDYLFGSSAAVVNGIVYVGSNELSYGRVGGNIYALNAYSGVKIWNYSTGNSVFAAVHSSPSVSDGTLFVGTDRFVFALNALTGTKIWAYQTDGQVESSPAVVDGVVYIGSRDGNIYALNTSTGSKIWTYVTGNGIMSSPAVDGGILYIGSGDGNVYALNASTGSKIWNYDAVSPISSSSPVLSGDTVYIGSGGGTVYAIDAKSGHKIWSKELPHFTGDEVYSTPAVANGRLYVTESLWFVCARCFDGRSNLEK
jgi:eukaryotic-like serine/threonine-protein kinase